jgi:hypothetical protein
VLGVGDRVVGPRPGAELLGERGVVLAQLLVAETDREEVAHAQHELVAIDRLGDEVVGTGLERTLHRVPRRVPGEDEHGDEVGGVEPGP